MKNLRVLIIDGLCVSGDFGLFPKQLKWLSWQKCPLERIPSNFPAANLVFLNMHGSAIKEFDLNLQCCPMLKELNLSLCKHLRRTPKFNGARSLETLLLQYCCSLTEIDQSICQLKSLQVLNINRCGKIQTLPVDLGDMQSLTSLHALNTGINELPKSVEKLKNLETLEVGLLNRGRSFPQRRVIKSLPTSLSRLTLKDCRFSEVGIHVDIGSLSSLLSLDLSGNSFQTLPSVSNLENLETLDLSDCKKLVDITGLDNLPSIERINMINCTSLQNPVNEGFFSAPALSIPSRKHPHKRGLKIYLQCNEIPGWCSNQVTAPSIRLTVPRHDKKYKFLGIVLWFVCDFQGIYTTGSFVVSVSHRERESMRWSDDIYIPCGHGELSCVYYISYLNRPFDGQMIKGGENITVHREDDIHQEDDRFYHTDIKKIGIHLLYLDQHGNVTSLPGEVDHSYSPFPEECSAGHKRAKFDLNLPADVDHSYSPFPEECSARHKRAKLDLNLPADVDHSYSPFPEECSAGHKRAKFDLNL